MIGELFVATATKVTPDGSLVQPMWAEIEKQYSHRSRRYHNLEHLEKLTVELQGVKEEIEDFGAIVFAIVYHDAVYNATKKDNEEKSAEMARKRLTTLSYGPGSIERVVAHILATKSHQKSEDNDTNLFTDADLSVLGAPWEAYREYYQQIRKEYAIYPDLLYKPGRRKVLQHFWTCRRSLKPRLSIRVTKGKPAKTWSGN
jgi:predicted metal-dependent HD superfamily phosphohydrolase